MPEEPTSPGNGPTSADFNEYQYVPPAVMSKIDRRRHEEAQRRERFLNAKTRTIGVDVSKLDAQVVEKKALEEVEKEEKAQ